ncbi:MAG TPA: nuclear transport factor 2 family protein [Stellaceae bacterium]|jgi:ketosteroid isomerase-like protein|nr:nuclear transport factor 2 family protein [Stellaceae bacterium]
MMTTAALTKETARDEAEILALLAALRQAHHDKDAAMIAAAYAADAVVCDLSPPLSHRGIDVTAKQAWLDTWEGPVQLETPPGTLTVDGDLAVHYGYTRMSGKPKAAPQPISFWLRDTICLKRGRDGWKIAHIHSSVPFYMDGSLRPAFNLQP